MKPENKQQLAKVLSYHLVIDRVDSKHWKGQKVAVKSTIGMPLTVQGGQAPLTVNNVPVSQPDLGADNGVIHVIDRVLLPPTPIAPRT